MEQKDKGSKSYLISIVMVAVLGGLLFGYDTAVISGAEKGLQAFFMGADDFVYTDFWHGFTSSSALVGCIIGSGFHFLVTVPFPEHVFNFSDVQLINIFFCGLCF